MGLGTFGSARWGAVHIDVSAPAGVEPPHEAAPPGIAFKNAGKTSAFPAFRVGIDAGSKTIKIAVVDAEGNTVHSLYHRHRSDIATTLADLIHELVWKHGDMTAPVSITGSAGIGIAEALGIPFVQEVVATTRVVCERHPEADCVIELGGEDAKIIYLTGGLEQRMNATCAGGTGDFIDGVAGLLNTRTRDFSKLAFGAQRTYPIASRCAVFAQTDVRPLLAAGASKSDIALSVLKAVVKQTIGGLAAGRPITGTVVFLGGPLNYIPALEREFRLALGLTRKTGIRPRDAHLYTAAGAALAVDNAPALCLSELEQRVRTCSDIVDDLDRLPPLFETAAEHDDFVTRHANEHIRQADGRARDIVASRWGRCGDTDAACVPEPVFLGFDAGSTTVKYAIVDASGALITSDYQHVEGDTLSVARRMMERALQSVESTKTIGLHRRIAHATVTGYGEDLLRAAFGFDSGVVETVAHLRAAQEYRPDVSFVLDIGGQDMKALWVRDGVVVDAVLNEACSSGCGAFVRSNTRALEMSDALFSEKAMQARRPIDLGAKCTVFMTSRVRHAQKVGASQSDIAAGVAYSVVNNALTRIIGADRVADMGDAVVVQGGTFKSDAVLRAFEKVTGVHAIRPKEAHLMGAYGAALVALDRHLATVDGAKAVSSRAFEDEVSDDCGYDEASPVAVDVSYGEPSSLISLQQIQTFSPHRSTQRCTGCGNACLLSVVEFGDGRRYVSGNRCERAYEVVFGEPDRHAGRAPNVVALEQKLVAACGNVRAGGRRGAVQVGLMNALNQYEAMPFWHGLFKALGFSILVPDDSLIDECADEAVATIPSESVCHPAKVIHVRYAALVRAGADVVFMPRYERGTRCPVSSGYVDALRDSVTTDIIVSPDVQSLGARGVMRRLEDQEALFQAIAALAPAEEPISWSEFSHAIVQAVAAQGDFDSALEAATAKALDWIAADDSRRGVVLVGRPYHVDPVLLHRIDKELSDLGFAVIPALGLAGVRQGHVRSLPLWKPAKHLIGVVEQAARLPRMDVVALRAFGCGYDAVAFDEARDRAMSLHRPFTELKIDDIADTAHIRIRLRTLAEAARQKTSATNDERHRKEGGLSFNGSVTPDLCSTAKELVRRVALQVRGVEPPYTVEIPFVCQDCLIDALPFELQHINGYAPMVDVSKSAPAAMRGEAGRGNASRAPEELKVLRAKALKEASAPVIGLLGNPFLVFDEELNEGVVAMLEKLGCIVAFPDAELLEVEDVRYIPQLDAFYEHGVHHVVYLQSFGCLKGHVQSRGAQHEFARRYPDMTVTVIDYDAESSALNRENRIRLAVEAARLACSPASS